MIKRIEITVENVEECAKEWRAMTDDNDHTTARIAIAEAFGLEFFMNAFCKIWKHHFRAGNITPEIANERYYLTHGMIALIRDKHGDKIADIVYKSL